MTTETEGTALLIAGLLIIGASAGTAAWPLAVAGCMLVGGGVARRPHGYQPRERFKGDPPREE